MGNKMNAETLAYWYWLASVKNVGPATFRLLLQQFGDPEKIYAVDLDTLRECERLPKGIAEAIVANREKLGFYHQVAQKQVETAKRMGGRILTLSDPDYPDILKNERSQAPPVLHVLGDLTLVNASRSRVAIVGTRWPLEEGRDKTYQLAANLAAANVVIVSGLALGIDTVAHRAALDSGGGTVAVLGCGLDHVYPPDNLALYEEIREKGLLVSEYPFGVRPTAENLRKRNKLIAALSQAVIVGQCPIRSGAMIAARAAVQQKRALLVIDTFSNGSVTSEGGRWLVESSLALPLVQLIADEVLEGIKSYVPPQTPERVFSSIWPGKSAKQITTQPKSGKKVFPDTANSRKQPKKRTGGTRESAHSETQPSLTSAASNGPHVEYVQDTHLLDTDNGVVCTAPVRVGDCVEHPRYGQGRVVGVEASGQDFSITVEFGPKDRRTFFWSLSKMKRVEVE